MKKRKRIILFSSGFLFSAFILCFVLCIPPVYSAALGVSNAVMNFNNLLKGGYAEDFVTISTDSSDNISISYTTIGGLTDWIFFKPGSDENFSINRDNPGLLYIIIQPPNDTQTGNYSTYVRIMSGPLGKPKGQYGSSIIASFLIKINIEISGAELVSCTAGGFDIKNIEVGYPLGVYSSIINNGNVRIRPTISLDIWDKDQKKLMFTKEFVYDEILPTTTRSVFKELDNNLPIGQYWVNINAPLCKAGSLITFDVVEKGMISDNGDLLRIDAPFNAFVNDIIPIKAVFKNTGTRTVTAKFKGTISLGDKIIGTIDTDSIDVKPGETTPIETFFQPKKEGHYIIRGRILYGNKLTFEQEAFTDISPSEQAKSSTPIFMISLIIIIIVILVLLILIKRKKRRIRKDDSALRKHRI